MNHTNCQFRDKHTVGGIVFYKHAFLVSVSFYVANVIFKRTENARIAINHGLFQCSNIRWITRKVFEHAACGLVFKHLPRDPSNV